MDLLESGLLKGHKVLAVSEDWNAPGGAGNGLGTLYAWKKACALAAQKYDGMDLATELASNEISAALYHTAGKGTRLAPLPASENNNKPGVVRLCACFSSENLVFRATKLSHTPQNLETPLSAQTPRRHRPSHGCS